MSDDYLDLLRIWGDEGNTYIKDVNFESQTGLPFAILYSDESIAELKGAISKGSPLFIGTVKPQKWRILGQRQTLSFANICFVNGTKGNQKSTISVVKHIRFGQNGRY